MIEGDLFVQWIVVPDDRPALPPVDEDIDISGLKGFSGLGSPTDPLINESSSGLLFGPDLSHNVSQSADMFDTITQYGAPPDAEQNMFLPTSDPSPSHISSYLGLLPPALSPDSSPTSVASSTPWLRTPAADPSLANVANVDAMWDSDSAEVKESCSSIYFLDQAGNSLEDTPLQVQDVMPEDIACTPQMISDTSLPQVHNTAPCGSLGSATPTPLFNTPTLVISPPGASASLTEAVPLGPAHCTSLPPSPAPVSQFAFSSVTCPPEAPLLGYSASPSLSPLSNLSFFSQSPSASSSPSPFIRCSSLPPTISPVPLSNSDEGVTDSDSSTFARVTSAKLWRKRSAETLDDDSRPWKIPKRSRAKDVDEEEWSPGTARVKHPRVAASSQSARKTSALMLNYSPNESSNCEIGQASEGHADATRTSCEICGQEFTRTSDYVRHLENSASHPETRKVWPCPHCDSTLGRKDALGRHVRTMHPGKPVIVPEGISGSQLHQRELFVQRTGQRKRQPRKDTRRYH